MDLNLFELEPCKYYDIPASDPLKKEKIKVKMESDMYCASVKIDGQYHRFIKQNGISKLQTRGKSVQTGTYGEVQDKVPHIFDYLNMVVPDNSLIIGEIYYEGETTNEVGSVLRCLTKTALKKQEQKGKLLKFYIHEVWAYNDEPLMMIAKQARVEKLKEIKKEWNDKYGIPDFIEFADYVFTVDEIKEMLATTLAAGGEGIVMTLKNSFVVPGTRTAWQTLKVKKELENDVDVFFTGHGKEATKEYDGKELGEWNYWLNTRTGEKIEGQMFYDYLRGNCIIPITKNFFYGWPGSVEIATIKDGKDVVIGYLSNLTEEVKEAFARDPKSFAGKVCSVNAMETTDDFKLRHAKFIRWREDLTKEDCEFSKIFGE